MGIPRILWESREYGGNPGNTVGIPSIQWEFQEYYGNPRNTMGIQRIRCESRVEMCGTKKIILRRDRDQRLNPRLYDGLNSVNFCTSEGTLFEKKEPKRASRRLNKLKKTSIEEFFR